MEPGVPSERVAALLQRLATQPSLSARNLTGDPLQSRIKLVNRLLRWLATDPELLSRPGPLLLHVMDLANPVVLMLAHQFEASCGMVARQPINLAQIVDQADQVPWLNPPRSHAGKVWQRLRAALQLTGACVLALQDLRAATLHLTELPRIEELPPSAAGQHPAAVSRWNVARTHKLLKALPIVFNCLAQIILACYIRNAQRPVPSAPSLRAMTYQQTVLLRYCAGALLAGVDIAEAASMLSIFSVHVLYVMRSSPQQRTAELQARAGHGGAGQPAAPAAHLHATGVNATAARLQARLQQRRAGAGATGGPNAAALGGALGTSSYPPSDLPSRADWHGQLRATFALLHDIRVDVQFVPSPTYGSLLLQLLHVGADGLQAMDQPDVWENPGAGLDLSEAVWQGHTFGDGPGAFIGGVMSALRVLTSPECSPLQSMRRQELHPPVVQLVQHILALTVRLHAQLSQWREALAAERCAVERLPCVADAPAPSEGQQAGCSSAAADPGCSTVGGSSSASTRAGGGCCLSGARLQSALAFCATLLDPNSTQLLDSLRPESGATIRRHVYVAAKQLMGLVFDPLHKVDLLRCAAEAVRLATCMCHVTVGGSPSIRLEDLILKLGLAGMQMVLSLNPRIAPQHSHAQLMPWMLEMDHTFRMSADMLVRALPLQLVVCEGDTVDDWEAVSCARAAAHKAQDILRYLQGALPQVAVLMGNSAAAQGMVDKMAAVAQLTRWAAILALHTHITAVMEQPQASRMPSQAVLQADHAAALVRRSRPAVKHAATTLEARLGAQFPQLLPSMGWWQDLRARAEAWGAAGGGHGEAEELQLLKALEAAFESLPSRPQMTTATEGAAGVKKPGLS